MPYWFYCRCQCSTVPCLLFPYIPSCFSVSTLSVFLSLLVIIFPFGSRDVGGDCAKDLHMVVRGSEYVEYVRPECLSLSLSRESD